MTFGKIYRKRQPQCRRLKGEHHPGARLYHFREYFLERHGRYRGVFGKNLLVMMRQGRVQFQRGPRIAVAEAGSALLVQSGWGEIKFFAPEDAELGQAKILEFDRPSVAQILRRSPEAETLALTAGAFPPEGVEIHSFSRRLEEYLAGKESHSNFKRHALELVIENDFEEVAGLFLAAFYEPRWEIMRQLESQILPNPVHAFSDSGYAIGAFPPRRDAIQLLGEIPEKWLKRRQMQLAKIWLRFGHPAEGVAGALGFPGEWELRSAFAAFWKRSCEAVQQEAALDQLSPGQLLALIRPCWWPAPRPINPILGPDTGTDEPDDDFDVNGQTRGERAEMKAADQTMSDQRVPAFAQPGWSWRTSSGKASEAKSIYSRPIPHTEHALEKLREIAPEFFAMESTGSELLVPIYSPLPNIL